MRDVKTVTRIGVIGDIHAEDATLRDALHHFAELAVDLVVAVGDVVDGPGDPDVCCALLEEHGVVTVLGNHDRWYLGGEMRDLPGATPAGSLDAKSVGFLSSLPATTRIDTARQPIILCHGLGDDDMATVRPWDSGYDLDVNYALQDLIAQEGGAVVVCGHSHRRMVRTFDELTVVNAGTLLREHDPCFAILDVGERKVAFYTRHDQGIILQTEVVRY